MKGAVWLRNRGRTDAFEMSPKQLHFALRVENERMRADIYHSAIATGLGMGGDKKALEELAP